MNESKPEYGVGELWDFDGRLALIAGNHWYKDGTIWVMDWDSGDKSFASKESLVKRDDFNKYANNEIVAKFEEWACLGNNDASWWLGWWFESYNLRKSIIYYLMALRQNPSQHRRLMQRVFIDLIFPEIEKNEDVEFVEFIKNIPEINNKPISSDWNSLMADFLGRNNTLGAQNE